MVTLRALSNNVLNNVEISGGADFNYDTELFTPFLRARLAMWYPVMTLEGSTVMRSGRFNGEDMRWREASIFAGTSVDLNWSKGVWLRRFSPVLGLSHTLFTGDLTGSLSSAVGQTTYLQERIRARKNLFTHAGVYLQLRANESVNELAARQVLVRSGVATRGIGVNHNLIVQYDRKFEPSDVDYRFIPGLSARGIGVVPGANIDRLSVDYHLPIWYPDRGFAGIFYVYRVRAAVFYDRVTGREMGTFNQVQNTGLELVFDTNLLNVLPMSLGIRMSKPVSGGALRYEFFLPVYRFSS